MDYFKRNDEKSFLKFLYPLESDNEIDVKELKKEIKSSDPFKEFDISINSVIKEAK